MRYAKVQRSNARRAEASRSSARQLSVESSAVGADRCLNVGLETSERRSCARDKRCGEREKNGGWAPAKTKERGQSERDIGERIEKVEASLPSSELVRDQARLGDGKALQFGLSLPLLAVCPPC